jgi:anaerobic magnesium-protoporphyrin IX monomethyl ester cyclase
MLKTLIIALYNYNAQGLDAWLDHGSGMAYTAAKNAGHDVTFLDMKALSSDEELKRAMAGYDLIGFGLKSSYYSIGMKIIKFAKQLGSKVMVAGYHATAAPNELVENPDIDYIFHGESEITFPKFLSNPDNFGREIFGEKVSNLDDLPFMDRSIFRSPIEPCQGWWAGGKRANMISVITSRGCPYKCSFCQPIEDNHFGKKLRRRSVDSVIEELLMLKFIYEPDCLMIHDDTFLLQDKWLEEFIEKYPQIGLPFWAAGRADGICTKPDLVRRLVNVGWELISVGFESGSQRILDKMKKGTTVEQNLEAAKIIKSTGAKIYANYMLGLPWETKWDVQQTMRMADSISAEMPSWAFFTPYPGCELADEVNENGWSLLDREHYDRCPSGEKVKCVDYEYLSRCLRGFREERPKLLTDIIIPTYNNESYTVACIESIKANTTPGTYRIIWVDNASIDPRPVEKVLRRCDHLSFRFDKNRGFVDAVNKGIQLSDAPTICLLNNDTLVYQGWLNKMIAALYADDQIGILGPLTGYKPLNHEDSPHCLNLHKDLLPEESRSWPLDKVNEQLEIGWKGQTTEAPFVAFLCALMRRELINKLGPLDPNFKFGMWDDVDYNMQVRKLGLKTVYLLDTCIYHRGRTTFDIIEKEENFNVGKLLRSNKHYLDAKWANGGIAPNQLTRNKLAKNHIRMVATGNSWRDRLVRVKNTQTGN